MKIYQQILSLKERRRGFHLVTGEIVQVLSAMGSIRTGICQVFIQHTSASLCINENADPTVRHDFEMYFNKSVPENDPGYRHDTEGSDDMPAHLKAALLGSSVMIPVHNGALALGTWQGIYLCEHRNHGGTRDLVITVWGRMRFQVKGFTQRQQRKIQRATKSVFFAALGASSRLCVKNAIHHAASGEGTIFSFQYFMQVAAESLEIG